MVATLELAVGGDVAVVVVGHRDRHGQRRSRGRRSGCVVVRVVTEDVPRVGGLGFRGRRVLRVVPAVRRVIDLRAHPQVLEVGHRRQGLRRVVRVRAGPGAGAAAVGLVGPVAVGGALGAPVEAVVLVARGGVGARLDIARLVGPLLAGAHRKQDAAEPDRLEVDVDVLLEAGVPGGAVVLGHRDARALEVVRGQAGSIAGIGVLGGSGRPSRPGAPLSPPTALSQSGSPTTGSCGLPASPCRPGSWRRRDTGGRRGRGTSGRSSPRGPSVKERSVSADRRSGHTLPGVDDARSTGAAPRTRPGRTRGG